MSALFAADALRVWTAGILQHQGVAAGHAETTALALLRTSLRGIDTHGIARLPDYVQRLADGSNNAHGKPQLDERHGLLRLHGDDALGQVAVDTALRACLLRAQQSAVVACSLEACGHLGALGVLLLPAVEAGCMALLCQRTPPIMALPGAQAPAIGNNPMAFVAPVPRGAPLVFDMALSAVARGHVAAAAREGTAIPPEWALDAQGRPTADPVAALAGAMQPVAGYKGLALATLVECLAGSLRSMPGHAPAEQGAAGQGPAGGASAFLLVVNPHLAVGRDAFEAHMQAWTQQFLAAGGADARYPGQRQAQSERLRAEQGIPVPPRLLAQLQALGMAAGRPLPRTD